MPVTGPLPFPYYVLNNPMDHAYADITSFTYYSSPLYTIMDMEHHHKKCEYCGSLLGIWFCIGQCVLRLSDGRAQYKEDTFVSNGHRLGTQAFHLYCVEKYW
jgi:hypothetical protein